MQSLGGKGRGATVFSSGLEVVAAGGLLLLHGHEDDYDYDDSEDSDEARRRLVAYTQYTKYESVGNT